jgi:hypothetical protein
MYHIICLRYVEEKGYEVLFLKLQVFEQVAIKDGYQSKQKTYNKFCVL